MLHLKIYLETLVIRMCMEGRIISDYAQFMHSDFYARRLYMYGWDDKTLRGGGGVSLHIGEMSKAEL